MRKTALTAIFMLIFSTASFAGEWWENIKIKGDLRYRHEMIDEEGKDARHRQRIRARLAIDGKINEEMKAVIQLATGSDDPVSTNQTLDDAFTTKGIGVDMAYFQYKPAKINGLTITGGKFHNPFFKPGSSELIWDSDLNPEGGTFNFTTKKDNIGFTVIGAGLWIDEDSKADDVSMFAGQGIINFDLNEKKTGITVGGSYFLYNNVKDHALLYEADDSKGNTYYMDVDENMLYANDYELLEVFLEVSHQFEKTPVKVMFDYVTNAAADSCENGWLAGVHIGKAKNPGTWDLRYIYREVEKDAVLGAFTDSDFRGGGTDANGHEFGGTYMLAKNAAFGVSYFINTIGLDAAEEDFGRLQVDLQLKF